jgi:hypothetical protein
MTMGEAKPAETRAQLMGRLRREQRWEQASAYKEEQRLSLRAEGMKRPLAVEESWRRMAEKFPPRPDAPAPAAADAPVTQGTKPAADTAAAFENAVKDLLPNASRDVELDWVYAHPAMRRGQRQDNLTQRVMVTVDDILTPPHGKAPSQAAVNTLVNWVDQPRRFFEQQDKKHKPGQGAAKTVEEEDMGLEEVKRLLAQVQGAVGPRKGEPSLTKVAQEPVGAGNERTDPPR